MLEFYLITRNPEMATRAKQTRVVQAERLNDRTSYNEDDAIVRSAYEMKMQKSAEMTDSLLDSKEEGVTCGYYNETEVIPGVIVKAIPTQAGLLPLVPEPFIPILQAPSSKKQYEMFILSEEFIEFHFLTSPVPRVFQLGLLGNLFHAEWGRSDESQMREFSLIDSNAEIANEGQVQWLN